MSTSRAYRSRTGGTTVILMASKYQGRCRCCHKTLAKGSMILWRPNGGAVCAHSCGSWFDDSRAPRTSTSRVELMRAPAPTPPIGASVDPRQYGVVRSGFGLRTRVAVLPKAATPSRLERLNTLSARLQASAVARLLRQVLWAALCAAVMVVVLWAGGALVSAAIGTLDPVESGDTTNATPVHAPEILSFDEWLAQEKAHGRYLSGPGVTGTRPEAGIPDSEQTPDEPDSELPREVPQLELP